MELRLGRRDCRLIPGFRRIPMGISPIGVGTEWRVYFSIFKTLKKNGGEGGIRTHVGRNAPNRFRVGAVVTASVPLR